jgi:hypothetical protein
VFQAAGSRQQAERKTSVDSGIDRDIEEMSNPVGVKLD